MMRGVKFYILYTPVFKSHLCIRRTPKTGERYWGKALIACIRRTPKIGKTSIEKKLK